MGLISPAGMWGGTHSGAIVETGGQADPQVNETSALEQIDLPEPLSSPAE